MISLTPPNLQGQITHPGNLGQRSDSHSRVSPTSPGRFGAVSPQDPPRRRRRLRAAASTLRCGQRACAATPAHDVIATAPICTLRVRFTPRQAWRCSPGKGRGHTPDGQRRGQGMRK